MSILTDTACDITADQEFGDLCFAFGLELDEVVSLSHPLICWNSDLCFQTTEKQMISKEQGIEKTDASDEVIYRIDVPANRYDLLCMEGLARGILIFQQKLLPPKFTVKAGAHSVQVTESVSHTPFTCACISSTCSGPFLKQTRSIRPHVTAAILRNVTLTAASYKSFIDLQDKLHQNVCRQRTLVSIGTHDLDTITGPVVYDARKPADIKFVPLKQTAEFTAAQLMNLYMTDNKLKPFLSIVQDKPLFPVFYDASGSVLSFPPIINSEKTKIKLTTRNIFIEITATDKAKASLVLDTLVTMFSEYCSDKFSVESVTVNYWNGVTEVYPKLRTRSERASVERINKTLGTKLLPDQMAKLLVKMSLESKVDGHDLVVQIPATRQDILHECDIAEDVGIAFGYNNIETRFPKVVTIGKQLVINKMCDQLRGEISRCGFTEALTFALCSTDDMEKISRSQNFVTISNPKTSDFQVVRTSLISGLLKTACANKKMPLPLKLFEVADVVLKDESQETGARNQRMLAVQYMSKTPGFEIVHGILDRVMAALSIPFKVTGYQLSAHKGKLSLELDTLLPTILVPIDSAFFDGRCALISLDQKPIGTMGVLHPTVMSNFGLNLPASVLELNVESLLQYYRQHENE